LYWTDSAKDTIEVASLDNSTLRSVLINRDLVNPRGIAVDPMQKYVKSLKCMLQFLIKKLLFSVNYTGQIGIERHQKLNGLILTEQRDKHY